MKVTLRDPAPIPQDRSPERLTNCLDCRPGVFAGLVIFAG
jgi:hypothetical protein